MRRAATLVACSMFAVVALAARQDSVQKPQATFRSGVELVMLDVSVLDAGRIPVKGLTAADFTVLQDGRPQRITAFTAVDLPERLEPSAAGWMQEVPPDIGRNEGLSERRILALVLDDATPMPAEEVPRVKMLARRVVERLGPEDLAAVVFTFNKRSGQEFTTDHARLLAAVERFNGSIDNVSDLGPYTDDPLQSKTVSFAFDQFSPKALQLYTAVVGTLKSLTEYLSDLPERRKAIVFASVGLPLDVEQAAPKLTSSEEPLGEAGGGTLMLFRQLLATFAAAQRANVNIYGLDPGGLRAPVARYDALSGTGSLDGAPGKLNRDFLEAVSANTGGFTLAESNEFDGAITQMLRENGSYYLLGYPRSATREGAFHRIEVRVNRPGVTVRARNGYYEARPAKAARNAPPALAQAMASLMPKADVAMQLAAAPLAVAGRREAAVAIAIGVREAVPPNNSGRVVDDVDVQVSAYDAEGKVSDSRRLNARVTLRSDAHATSVCEMLARLDLPPGRYQIRAAVQSSLQGKSGSVYYDLDVPDFARLPLSVSGVLVTANPGPAAAPKDAFASLVPITPTSTRIFGKDQQVTALLRVYEGGTQPLEPVAISVTVFDASGGMVFDSAPTLAVERFSKDRAADCAFDLPMKDLEPGPHLLRIEAHLGEKTVRRDVRFEVK